MKACALLALLLLPRLLAAQQTAKLVPALGWDFATQGPFATSVAVDLQNNVWAGTEGKGLWRYDARAKKWTQFTTKDGLGDDCVYALAVDKLGRVWAGHLNHGVSVWNGEKWKNYGLLDGPLGDRVFAIAICPTDGDVWIATDCGVARYSLAKDDWDYYTRASGLPSNQIQAVAFDSKGNIFLGTQCDGIAMATADDKYKKWKTVAGPLQMPDADKGDGLACDMVNEIAVVRAKGSENIVAVTPAGMSVSENGGKDWYFVRGLDWKANIQGLYDNTWKPVENVEEGLPPLLAEDWSTCIRQDEKTKNMWVGHRTKGLEIRDADKGDVLVRVADDTDSYFIRDICLPEKGPPLVAVYDVKDGGLLTLDSSKDKLEPGAAPPQTAPPLPGPPKPTDAATFTALGKELDVFKNQLKSGEGVYLGDDWRTEGDWVGRYGVSFAMLCGLGDDGVYASEPGFDASVVIGPHNKQPAGIPTPMSYVANATTDDMRTLYSPTLGHRSEAEVNDYSYTRDDYPPEWEGPDLWVDVKVPAGIHCLSLYFTNNDSQVSKENALNKFRDFDLQLLRWQEDRDAVQKSQPLARARVTDFWGGVYKQFVVAGPARYYVRVGRNHSYCTKLQGVFIDRLTGDPAANRKPLPGFDTVDYSPAAVEDKSAVEGDAMLSATSGLWELLDKSFDKTGVAGLQFPLRIVAYRAAAAANAPEGLLATWRWQMGIWTPDDRDAFDKAMAEAFKAYSDKNPSNGDGN